MCVAQRIKCWESSETCVGKVSRRSEPSSRGKRPFKVSKKLIPKISNGRKIARIAPILSNFSRKRSRRPDLDFKKIWRAVLDENAERNRENVENFRECVGVGGMAEPFKYGVCHMRVPTSSPFPPSQQPPPPLHPGL